MNIYYKSNSILVKIVAQSIQHLIEIIKGIEHLISESLQRLVLSLRNFVFQDGTGIENNNSHASL